MAPRWRVIRGCGHRYVRFSAPAEVKAGYCGKDELLGCASEGRRQQRISDDFQLLQWSLLVVQADDDQTWTSKLRVSCLSRDAELEGQGTADFDKQSGPDGGGRLSGAGSSPRPLRGPGHRPLLPASWRPRHSMKSSCRRAWGPESPSSRSCVRTFPQAKSACSSSGAMAASR